MDRKTPKPSLRSFSPLGGESRAWGTRGFGNPSPEFLGLMATPGPQPGPPETRYIRIHCARISVVQQSESVSPPPSFLNYFSPPFDNVANLDRSPGH